MQTVERTRGESERNGRQARRSPGPGRARRGAAGRAPRVLLALLLATAPVAGRAANTTLLGDYLGSEATSVAQACPASPLADVDHFSLATSLGTDSVTSVTLTLTGTGGIQRVDVTSDDGLTTYGQLASPGTSATVSLTTPIPVTITPTQYRVKVLPKGYGITASYSVTARVSSLVATNAVSGTDAGSGTVVVDGAPPDYVSGAQLTTSGQQASFSWTNPTTDFDHVVVLRSGAGKSVQNYQLTSGTTYTAGTQVGTDTVLYVGTLTSFTDTLNAQYTYGIATADRCNNYKYATLLTPAYVTVGEFYNLEPGNNRVCPGAAALSADMFTMGATNYTANGYAVTAVTVALTNPQAVQSVRIVMSGTVLGQLANPGSTAVIPLSPPIQANSTFGIYNVQIAPAPYASLTSGQAYPVTAKVIGVTTSIPILVNDSNPSAVITVDWSTPTAVSGLTGAASAPRMIHLAWTNPSGTLPPPNFGGVVVLRSQPGAAIQTTALADGATYAAGSQVGADTVVYTGTGTALDDVVTGGLTYQYAVFSVNPCSGTGTKYSAPVLAGPITATVPSHFLAGGAAVNEGVDGTVTTFLQAAAPTSAGAWSGWTATAGPFVPVARFYGPTYADQRLVAANATASLWLTSSNPSPADPECGGPFPADSFRADLLDHDPDGPAGNGTLIGSGTVTSPGGTAALVPVAFANAPYTIAPGHRLVLQLNYSASTADSYCSSNGLVYGSPAMSSGVAISDAVTCTPSSALAMPAGQGAGGVSLDPAALVTATGVSGLRFRVGLAPSDGFAALDPKWTSTNIGSGVTAGAALTASGGQLRVQSPNGTGAFGTTDYFRFVSQPVALSGDFTVDVRVDEIDGSASSPRAGLMVRQDLSATAVNAALFVAPGAGAVFQARSTTGGATASTTVAGVTPAAWIRLSRAGGTLTGYYSSDGVSWTQAGSQAVSLTGTFYVGVAVGAGSFVYPYTASFSRFLLTQPYVPSDWSTGTYATAAWPRGTYWLLAQGTTNCGNPLPPVMGAFHFSVGTTTLGDHLASEPPDVPQACPAPGASGATYDADAFTLSTSVFTDSVTALTLALTGTPSAAQSILVTSDDGATVYGQVTPSSLTPTVALATPIPVTTTPRQFRLKILPAAYAALASGQSYPLTARVTTLTSNNDVAGADASGATVTVDRAPPTPPASWSAAATATPNQIALSWQNPATDFTRAVILRSAGGASVQTTRLTDGTSYVMGGTLGTDTAAYVGAAQAYSDQAQGGLAYRYLAFFGDACGNYSAGVPAGPATPVVPPYATTVGALTATPGFCSQVSLSAAFSGDGDLDNAATFARGSSPFGPFTPASCASAPSRGLTTWSCVDDSPTTGGLWYYQVTFTDGDGVNGQSTALTGPVVVSACADGTGALTVIPLGATPDVAAAPPGSVNVTAGKFRLNVANGSVQVTGITLANTAAKAAPPGELQSVSLYEDLGTTPGAWDAGDAKVATAVYDPGRMAWVLPGFAVTAGNHDYVLTVAVTLGADPTAGEQFRPSFGTADVSVISGARILNTATVTGGTVTIAGALAGAAVGDPTPQSLVPMVSILNPGHAATVSTDASSRIRVQVQVYDPSGSGVSSVKLSRAAGASGTFTDTLAPNAAYASVAGAKAGVYQADLAFTPGAYVLQAQAVSASGNTGYSSPAVITVNAKRTGDGNLLARANSSQLCVDCHNVKTHSSQSTADPATGLSKYGSWSTTCRDCHTPHNTHNAQLLRESIVPPSYGGYVPAKTVVFQDRITGDSGATSTAVSFVTSNASLVAARTTGPCQACHTRTASPAGVARWRGAGNQDPAHYAGTDTTACTGCHSHQNGFRGREAQGGESCAKCHGAKLAGMQAGARASAHALGAAGASDAPQDNATAWGNPLAANAPAARSCVDMCHPDHVHNDPSAWPAAVHASNLHRSPLTAASRALTRDTTPSSATYGQATAASGAGVLRADHVPGQVQGCMACHQNPVDASRPYIDATRYDLSAHNTTSAGGTAWEYVMHDDAPGATPSVSSRLQRNCTKCHAGRQSEGQTPSWSVQGNGPVQGPHWSDNPALLAGALAPAGDPTRNVCYNCHGGGTGAGKDFSGKNVAQAVARGAAGARHPVDAVSQHSTAVESAATYGTRLGGAPRHAGCADCHDAHQARSGAHTTGSPLAGPTLQGAYGATLSTYPPGWNPPASPSYWTAGRLQAGVDLEAALCFKCHSAWYWGSGTPPTSPDLGAAATDQAREFNPNNLSFHPVLSDCSKNIGRIDPRNLLGSWNKTANVNRMTCTDCHASDSTSDPAGPHGAGSRFLLKGPNTAWDASVNWAGNYGKTGSQGIFCFNCHDPSFAYTRNPMHTDTGFEYHGGMPCQTCHAAVPHGGPQVGLLVAGAGSGAATWAGDYDGSPTYAASQWLYIAGYPGAGNTWQQGNCGCGGPSHSE
ncbi:DUF1349 domain-containing protein [Anaeromyxobacter paludicola]|uniref:Uncharacterized protein n=1 Tax=Anaeromyxobacter paludicola TaxID=2918171 RepID=A0ABM7XAQ9_9BACT|nr:DUF1349 domain-containing protein [Anaeromyxobacter paludicola]BDG08919.1 hypothetical protein AMPC_20320 [Anaeromyxobacter paludicola]